MNGVGADEIIAETPRHDRSLHELEVNEIADVIRTYVARIVDLERDKRMRYVLIFKNHGQEAGAHTITHSISQLMALPVTPRVIKAKLMAARDYYALKERCVYCDVLHQELTDRKRLIAENDDFVSLAPFASRSPFEVSVFPKFHSSAFSRISPLQIEKLAWVLRDALQKLDKRLGGPPYNLALQDRPFLRPREGYWKTIEEEHKAARSIFTFFALILGASFLKRRKGGPRMGPPSCAVGCYAAFSAATLWAVEVWRYCRVHVLFLPCWSIQQFSYTWEALLSVGEKGERNVAQFARRPTVFLGMPPTPSAHFLNISREFSVVFRP
jgi:Galactose-1-phosphate uridyl transferase, N-terminal domain